GTRCAAGSRGARGSPRASSPSFLDCRSAARPEQQRRDGLGADCEIDDDVAVSQVPEVIGELLRRAVRVERVAAPKLRPAGDAGLDKQPPGPERNRALQQV